MRKITLLKTMLLWLCLAVGGNVWGEEYTIGWGTASGENSKNFTSTSGAVDGILSFSTAKNSSSTAPAHNENSSELRLYYNNGGDGGSITITPAEGITITGAVMTTSTSPSVKYTVDGGSATSVSVSSNTYTVSGISAAQSLKFQNVNTTNTQLRIKTIKVTYESAASDTRTAVNMTGFSAASTTLVKGNTTTTTVTNDQTGWTAAYTYTSSDEEVATVAADGVITAVAKGTATITATLNVDAEDASYKAGSTKKMTVGITVKNPNHTATFYANGTACHTTEVEEGEAIDFPASDPSDLAGKVFVGWVETEIDGTTDDEPSFVTSADMGTNNVNFYAVFATEAVKDGIANYTLDYNAETDLSSSTQWGSYGTSFSYTAGDGGQWIVKAYKYLGMQINTGKDASIKVPVCSGNIQTIEITCSLAKAVGFSTSDYKGSGTISYLAEGSDETSQTLDLRNQNVTTGYIVPKGGNTQITKIVVNYLGSVTTYSDYCTSVTVPAKITDAGYKTLYCDAALNFEGVDGLKAFIAEKEGTKVNFKEVSSVPAETGVLLKGNAGTYQIPVVAGSSTNVSTNQFLGVLEDTEQPIGIFVLMNGAEGVGFYKTTKAFTVGANTAYLPAGVAEAKSFIGFDFGETTGVESLPLTPTLDGEGQWYNMAGQRVAQPTKGLYIVNGKKVVVK